MREYKFFSCRSKAAPDGVPVPVCVTSARQAFDRVIAQLGLEKPALLRSYLCGSAAGDKATSPAKDAYVVDTRAVG